MMDILYGDSKLIDAKLPLDRVYHDTTLYGDGTKSKPLRVLASSVFPTQTGNSGKYLTTNGTTLSWATPTDMSGIYSGNGTVPTNTVVTLTDTLVFADDDSNVLSLSLADAGSDALNLTKILFQEYAGGADARVDVSFTTSSFSIGSSADPDQGPVEEDPSDPNTPWIESWSGTISGTPEDGQIEMFVGKTTHLNSTTYLESNRLTFDGYDQMELSSTQFVDGTNSENSLLISSLVLDGTDFYIKHEPVSDTTYSDANLGYQTINLSQGDSSIYLTNQRSDSTDSYIVLSASNADYGIDLTVTQSKVVIGAYSGTYVVSGSAFGSPTASLSIGDFHDDSDFYTFIITGHVVAATTGGGSITAGNMMSFVDHVYVQQGSISSVNNVSVVKHSDYSDADTSYSYSSGELTLDFTIPSSATGTTIFSVVAEIKIISSNGLT